MKTKSVLFDIKEFDGSAGAGTFTGYASVFNNVDSYGDKVIPGAFTKSLASYGEAGANIPCYWSHQMSDPMMCIGWTKSAVEDEHGLLVEVQLDLDNPNAAQAHKLIKAGVVNQMSFAYEVLDFAEARSEDEGWYCELRELKIFEVSLVQVGANQSTELLDVKHNLVDVKAGRKISSSNEEKLTQAISLINEVLESTDEAADSSDEEPTDVNDEEQETAKSEERHEVKSRMLDAVDIAEIEIQLLKGAI
ncbi:HK97 family phage prohead protease [Rothia terrae]|uniref:HK97 family phage prohead protease n=1 Tax=Rothia terrae TaxID=396015 RepID=UPI00380AF0D0